MRANTPEAAPTRTGAATFGEGRPFGAAASLEHIPPGPNPSVAQPVSEPFSRGGGVPTWGRPRRVGRAPMRLARLGNAEVGTLLSCGSATASRPSTSISCFCPGECHRLSRSVPALAQLDFRELDREMRKRVALQGTARFTATSTHAASFVPHDVGRGHAAAQVHRPRPWAPRRADDAHIPRDELTSSGAFKGWSVEEMASCRGHPTFGSSHTFLEPSDEHRRRPARLGRNVHYFSA